MSNLMDPDGTNRIIKQQITEWYAELDAERRAKLVEAKNIEAGGSLQGHVRRALVGLARMTGEVVRPLASSGNRFLQRARLLPRTPR